MTTPREPLFTADVLGSFDVYHRVGDVKSVRGAPELLEHLNAIAEPVLAAKNAEIERLKGKRESLLLLADERDSLRTQVTALTEENQRLGKIKGIACLNGHDLTVALACGHCFDQLRAQLALAKECIQRRQEWEHTDHCGPDDHSVACNDLSAVLQSLKGQEGAG